MREQIGILHPGAMGISVAAAAQNSGHQVWWCEAGRSGQTHGRAQEHGLLGASTLAELCQSCTTIISVCPPHAAEDVAESVIGCGFAGLYLDANAISPERVQRIGARLTAEGISFVDGGIIGGPAWEPRQTWLYLSGPEAERAAALFAAGPLETEIIGSEIGKASALKMCYAAYTKGTTALLCAILAAASANDITAELTRQWSRDDANFAAKTEHQVRKVTAKAWRFAGEMEEIAATFAAVGLPAGFHGAASAIYNRLAHFKDAAETPELAAVIQALLSDA